MSPWTHPSRHDWSTAGDEIHGFRRWARAWKLRRSNDRRLATPRGGTAGPAAKDPPASAGKPPATKTVREQYGISAMIYGLLVLLGGIYCAMTDAGRLASERGFALDAANWRPRHAPRSALRSVPSIESFSTAPLLRRANPRPQPTRDSAVARPEQSADVPQSHLEPIGSPRYVTVRDGA